MVNIIKRQIQIMNAAIREVKLISEDAKALSVNSYFTTTLCY